MMKRRKLTTGRFEFEAGGSLDSAEIVFYTSPREYRPGDKVVWLCHALTGNADPEDWWPGMVGSGKVIDTSDCYVVCVSMLCSAYGACGPASINPATGRPWLLDFPRTTVRDMVKAEILVRKALGIESIDVLLGPSIGGFQAVEWAIMEPDVIRRLILLATDARTTPFLTAYNESQRMAIKADPTFFKAEDIHGGEAGLKCARAIALISYRSYEGYNSTQPEDEDALFADRAASYQRYQGEKLVARGFDAYSYWYLMYTIDSMNAGRGRGGVEKALLTVKAETTVINVTSDQLFPPRSGRRIAGMIPGASYFEIESAFGHDGFLLESDQLTAIIKPIVD